MMSSTAHENTQLAREGQPSENIVFFLIQLHSVGQGCIRFSCTAVRKRKRPVAESLKSRDLRSFSDRRGRMAGLPAQGMEDEKRAEAAETCRDDLSGTPLQLT